jgi:dipeptidyl aminopeptidase/acylaminoacyl peptidase
MSRAITAEEFVAAPVLSDPRLSPNGQDVAYVERAGASSRLMVNGKAVTSGAAVEDQPRWMPDGQQLVCRSNRAGSPQLFLQPWPGGTGRQLTRDAVGVDRYALSPRGDRIAFVSRDPAVRDPYVEGKDEPWGRVRMLTIASGETETVVAESAYVGSIAWAPDGDDLAYVLKSDPDLDGRSLPARILSLRRGKLAQLRGAPDDIRWLPSGIVYAGTVRMAPCSAGCLYRLDGVRICSGIDDCLVGFASDREADAWVTVARALTTLLVRVDPKTGSATVVYEPKDGDLIAADVVAGHWAGIVSFGDKPPVVVRDGEIVADTSLSEFEWADQEPFYWRSTDGQELDGLLLRPKGRGDGPMPLINLVHGGGARYTMGFQQPFSGLTNWGQWLALSGFAVIMPNYRGGPGHGDAFEAYRCEHGPRLAAWSDVDSATDEAILRGIADPNRLGVGGWSYGGYMSGWAITHTRRYHAAVLGAGLYSHTAFMLETDIPATTEANVGSRPWDGIGPFPHELASPVAYASAAKTPALILHGQADIRVPVGQSRGMYRALRYFGCPVEMVLYPREGHFIQEPAHRLDILTRIRAWYQRWLLAEVT